MLDPKNIGPGQEQYEQFEKRGQYIIFAGYQYEYRHADGHLFTCVKKTLAECRAARDEWVARKEEQA